MSRLQYADNRGNKNTFIAEVTKGQLIVIICLCLFVAMACFGVGILVARMDPSLEGADGAAPLATAEGTETPEMETYTTPAFGDDAEKAPAATTPRAQRTPETPPPRNPFTDNTPRMTALPPLSPYRSLPVQAEAPTRIPRPDTPAVTTAAPPAATTATSPPATAAPALTPIDPIEPPVMDAPVATAAATPAPAPVAAPKPEPAKPAAATSASSGVGKFGVQLAAFSGSDRRARAESFQRKVKSEFKVDAAIIPSSDDVHYRVIAGSFPTREAASAACTELKSKTGLNEAFVRPL